MTSASSGSIHSRIAAVSTNHQHVGAEVEQVDREEVADAVGVAADARDQVAGPLAAEELQRQTLQDGRTCVAQIGAIRSLTQAST